MATPRPRLIFSGAIDSLLKMLQHHTPSPGVVAQLTAMRMGPTSKLEPAYPAEDWAKAVRLLGADLFPQLSEWDQHAAIGKGAVTQFADTLLGKAMFAATKVLGTRRTLERMTHNLRSGANFIETRFTTIDAQHQELWINDVSGVPGFYAGLIGAGAEYLSDWPDTITVKARDGEACLYTLRRAR